HGGVPAGSRGTGLPAPPVPSRHAAPGLRSPRPVLRGAVQHGSPLHLLPRTGGPHAMTDETPAEGGSTPTPSVESTQMLTALVKLRGALQAAELPLETPGVADHRQARADMVSQLEDYVIPRLMTIEAPMLAVVGG